MIFFFRQLHAGIIHSFKFDQIGRLFCVEQKPRLKEIFFHIFLVFSFEKSLLRAYILNTIYCGHTTENLNIL